MKQLHNMTEEQIEILDRTNGIKLLNVDMKVNYIYNGYRDKFPKETLYEAREWFKSNLTE